MTWRRDWNARPMGPAPGCGYPAGRDRSSAGPWKMRWRRDWNIREMGPVPRTACPAQTDWGRPWAWMMTRNLRVGEFAPGPGDPKACFKLRQHEAEKSLGV